MKIALIIACIGHIICGITDCMLAYMKMADLGMVHSQSAVYGGH